MENDTPPVNLNPITQTPTPEEQPVPVAPNLEKPKKEFPKTLITVMALIITLLLGVTAFFAFQNYQLKGPSGKQINSFEDCKKAKGSRILPTFPETCVSEDGQRFTDIELQEPSQNPNITLISESLEITNIAEMGFGNKYKLSFDYPSNWNVQKITTNHNQDQLKKGCADFSLENKVAKTSINLSTLCNGYPGNTYPQPDEYEVINTQENDQGEASFRISTIRYFSTEGNVFNYAQIFTLKGQDISKTDKMAMEILVSDKSDKGDRYFIPIKADFSAPSGTTISQTDLEIADDIVKSFELTRI